MQTNWPHIKWKFFLWKIRPQSGRRKGRDAELNSFSNCHKFRSKVCVSVAQETGK